MVRNFLNNCPKNEFYKESNEDYTRQNQTLINFGDWLSVEILNSIQDKILNNHNITKENIVFYLLAANQVKFDNLFRLHQL